MYPGYINGAHSSVDFNFDRYLVLIVKQANKKAAQGEIVPDVLKIMPPLTLVTRPYSKVDKYHRHIEKINELNGHSYENEDGRFVFTER